MGCGASAKPLPPPASAGGPVAIAQPVQAQAANNVAYGAPVNTASNQPKRGFSGSGNIQDFLTGLGVKDVAKAVEVLRDAGIVTRSDFFDLDKEMRVELDEELKKGGVNLGDRAKLKKAENATVSVKQGNGEVPVLMLQPGQAMQTASSLERVFLGLGWVDKDKSKPIDVDASCIGFSSGKPDDIVFFGNLGNSTKSLKHSGDVLTGTDQGKAIADMERIYVWLPKLPDDIDTLVFVANVYTPNTGFGDLQSAYIRMANADTNQELARLTLSGGGLKGNSLIFAKVYRVGPKGPWHFQTLGMPMTVPGCTSIQAMIPELQESGCAFSPPGAIKLAPGAPPPASAPSAAGDPASKKKKAQTPTGVYVAGALAVATVAGVAAATAIFMTTDLSPASFAPDLFEGGVDFANMVPTGDAITGIGEGIADGAEGAFEWASSVTESVDVGAIGDSLGDAVGGAGDAIGGFASDAMAGAPDALGAVGEGLAGAGDWAGGAAGDAAGAIGDADYGGAMDAVGGVAEGAGGAIGSAAEGIAENAGGVMEGAVGLIGGLISSVAGMFDD